MKGRSITLYLDADNEQAIQQRLFAPVSRSEEINTMLRRYTLLMDATPEAGLSPSEWKFLKDALRDTWLRTHPLSSPQASLQVQVIDAVRAGRHDAYSVNGQAVINKIQALSAAQVIGVLDQLERAWTLQSTSAVKAGRKARTR